MSDQFDHMLEISFHFHNNVPVRSSQWSHALLPNGLSLLHEQITAPQPRIALQELLDIAYGAQVAGIRDPLGNPASTGQQSKETPARLEDTLRELPALHRDHCEHPWGCDNLQEFEN